MKSKEEEHYKRAELSLARRSLERFTKYTFNKFVMTAYQGDKKNLLHKRIIDVLEKVESGEIKRLMVFCPPRLGKSNLVSQYFPARFLGRDPSRRVIVSSYGSELASDFGRKTKQICSSNEFKEVFSGFEFSKDKKEGGNWETSEGGGYYSVGVGGALTGKGGDCLIVDDPVKDHVEADSPTIQQRNINRYDTVLSTRDQNQNTPIIVMMTRWNTNDLAGYLEEEERNGGDKRHKLIIQGIDENENEIIRPGKWDAGFMKKKRKNKLPKTWAALYQQDPIAAQDGIFKREYFDYFLMSDFEREDGLLKKNDLRCGIFIDPAFSSNAKSDDAVVHLLGKHKISKEIYQLDTYAGTSAPSKTFANMQVIINKAKVNGFHIDFISVEEVNLNKDQTKFIKDLKLYCLENQINIPIRIYKPRGKKEERITANLEVLMSQQGLKFRGDFEEKALIRRLETQFLDFPHGKHDDMIDCLAQGVSMFNTVGKPVKRPGPTFHNKITGRYAGAGNIENKNRMYGL